MQPGYTGNVPTQIQKSGLIPSHYHHENPTAITAIPVPGGVRCVGVAVAAGTACVFGF
jgi:hypothetical protein